MFASSGEYTGYGKGKYSHALPAGVAVIGLLFLAVGVIIAISFPGIVSDWTKADVCVVKETDKRFGDWITDADRDVTVLVSIGNWTNLDAVLRSRDEKPRIEWTKLMNYREQSRKENIQFYSGKEDRVTFRKSLEYPSTGNPSEVDLVSIPNLWLLKQYEVLSSDPLDWLSHVLPRLLSETAVDRFPNAADLSQLWIGLTSGECRGSDSNFCSRFSFPRWAREGAADAGVDISSDGSPWKLILRSLVTEILSSRRNETADFGDDCFDELVTTEPRAEVAPEAEASHRCPACFAKQPWIRLAIWNHRLLAEHARDQALWSRLRFCYVQQTSLVPANISMIGDRQFVAMIRLLNEFVFHHLRKELALDAAARRGLFDITNVGTATAAKPTAYSPTLGILTAVFGGSGDHSYDWNTCHVRWNINADVNFQWRSLDSRPVEWEAKSEYFVPPATNMQPCLRPPAPRRIPFLFDGLWRPATFHFVGSESLHGETVYKYQLTAGNLLYMGLSREASLSKALSTALGSLPYDEELSDELRLNLTEVLGFHSFLTPFAQNGLTVGLDEPVAFILVEPITGSIWHVTTTYEIGIIIPRELAEAANVSQLAEQLLPIARITRTSQVRPAAVEFLKTQLKPMLAVICGGVVMASLLAITFVGLALALVVKLHWVPRRDRIHVQPEPQDLQMLNTVKLRKLLGN